MARQPSGRESLDAITLSRAVVHRTVKDGGARVAGFDCKIED